MTRRKIEIGHVRVTISPAHVGSGYRLALCRFQEPTEGAWVPTYDQGLPMRVPTRKALLKELRRLRENAAARYEERAEEAAEWKERLIKGRKRRHEEEKRRQEGWDVETEPHPNGGTVNRLVRR